MAPANPITDQPRQATDIEFAHCITDWHTYMQGHQDAAINREAHDYQLAIRQIMEGRLSHRARPAFESLKRYCLDNPSKGSDGRSLDMKPRLDVLLDELQRLEQIGRYCDNKDEDDVVLDADGYWVGDGAEAEGETIETGGPEERT